MKPGCESPGLVLAMNSNEIKQTSRTIVIIIGILAWVLECYKVRRLRRDVGCAGGVSL